MCLLLQYQRTNYGGSGFTLGLYIVVVLGFCEAHLGLGTGSETDSDSEFSRGSDCGSDLGSVSDLGCNSAADALSKKHRKNTMQQSFVLNLD
jgi:hypothetical protein